MRVPKRILLYGLLGATLKAAAVGGLLFYYGFFDPPDLSRLYDQKQVSIIYDSEKEILDEFCLEYCREPMPLAEMGDFPKFAIAAEDKDFENRPIAIDLPRALKAFVRNLWLGRIESGASTIQMQLAGTFFLAKERQEEAQSGKRSWWRKGRQAYLAVWLDWYLTKDQILEFYLNNIYCGRNRSGVKICSRAIFGKTPAELDIPEMALEIGMWRRPIASSLLNAEEALKLRGRVLGQFAERGLISADDKKKYDEYPLPQKVKREKAAPHFVEHIRRDLTRDGRLVDQGLRIYTTLDPLLQKTASQALNDSIEEIKKLNPELAKDIRGGAIAIDVRTGAIKIWAAYPSFAANQYDPIYQTARHTGSTFKIFTALAWLFKGGRLSCADEGKGPCRWDDSYGTRDGKSGIFISMGGGKRHYLQNFPYQGMARYIGVAEPILCLAESRNVCFMSSVEGVSGSRAQKFTAGKDVIAKDGTTIRTRFQEKVLKEEILAAAKFLKITIPTIDPALAKKEGLALIDKEMAKRLGLPENAIDPGLTLGIGSIDVSLYEMTRAMSALMEGLVEPYAVEEIYNPAGELVKGLEIKEPEKILDEAIRLQMIRGLRSTIEFEHGTGKTARTGDKARSIPKLNSPVIGKTGTATNQAGKTTDNWFLGCRYPYCMGIWIGREKKLPMETVEIKDENGRVRDRIQHAGGRNALPVFTKTMKVVESYMNAEPFPENTNPKKPFRLIVAPGPAPEEKEDEEKIEIID